MADLNTLDPRLAPWAKYLYSIGKYYDGRLVVTSARRSMAKQQRLYNDWMRGLSNIPAAKPGFSLHQHGMAFDLARIGISPHGDPLLNYLGYLGWRTRPGALSTTSMSAANSFSAQERN